MPLVKFAVKRPVTIVIITAVLLILGFFTFNKLPVDLLPEMKFPVAAVITSYPGAGPEEVESQLTIPLESAVTTLSNINQLQSISSDGQSILIVTFNWGTNMDFATAEIRDKIGYVEPYLPSSATKPMIMKMDPSMMPIIQMGISGGGDLSSLQEIAEEYIEPRLSRIPEVASIIITGGLEREVTVEVDPVKLENYHLTLAQVNQVLQAENFNMSGGKMELGGREYYVRNLQQFETVKDIENVAILTATGNIVYLKDIATVVDGYKDQTQITKVDGEYAVGVHIMKQTDANTVEASKAVREEMEKIQQELGKDLNVKIVMDQAAYIVQSNDNTKKMIMEGALLAILILFLFLRNARSTLIIFTAIPLSIITCFILMYFTGNTVNLLTMGGLALGVGRIVDDSIVVFENIYRHRSLGLSPMEAAITGASEVSGAVIASTTTLISVFIPIVFVEGLASIIFKPMALTISFAIFCSLIVALTIIPLMSSRMLSDRSMAINPNPTGRIQKITSTFGIWLDNLGEKYKALLQLSLARRRRVILLVTVLMIASFACMPLVGAEFMPASDSGEISVTIEVDKGSKISATEEISDQVEEVLRSIPEVETIFASVGSAGTSLMSSGQTDTSTFYVKLVPKNERSITVNDMTEEIRQKVVDIPGAKIKVSVMDMMSMMSSGGQISVQIRGDDLEVLKELSNEIADLIRNVPGTREVVASLTDGSPEMQVKIDRQRAANYGLTPIQVAGSIKSAMEGTVATNYKVGGSEVDVRVRYIPEGNKDLSHLSNLTILSPTGAVIKLSQIAVFEVGQGPVSINRIDQVRHADINGYLMNRDLNSVITDIQAQVDKLDLPAGYTVEYTGQNEEMVESFGSLAVALLLALLLVYAVMAVQYESFFNPFVIMFSIPTAIIGVVFGLLLTGRTFSVTAFIGIIMLVGIVVSNAIIFVDYLNKLRERGMERNEAIVEAGKVRLRPILMTALTTILAMFPMALGLGEGGELQAPLATVVVAGLTVSTFITLLLVPVVYTIFDDWGQNLSRRFKLGKSEKALDA
jgi:HAE1 family hydrophobic/amphiphilic exporter-1